MTNMANMTTIAQEQAGAEKSTKPEEEKTEATKDADTTTTMKTDIEKDSSCQVCFDKFDLMTRRKIKCEYCDFTACKRCIEKFLLSQPVPQCMNTDKCARLWTRKFMKRELTANFLSKDYKKHSEALLFDKERAYFQATQLLLEDERRKAKIYAEIKEIEDELAHFAMDANLRISILRQEIIHKPREEKEHRQFVRPCIYKDCRGFLSTRWKCGLCERWVCSLCHEPKERENDTEHHCKPEQVAAVESIKKETKPCPKCGTNIYKISGCDQMWCTICNTPFSWKAGTVIHGPIHNPHYHEYLARTGGTGGTLRRREACEGREVHDIDWTGVERNFVKTNDAVFLLPRRIRHLEDVELRALRRKIVQSEEDINLSHRKSYLSGSMTEEQFRTLSLRRHKEQDKNRELCQIHDMTRTVLLDIFQRTKQIIEEKLNRSFQPVDLYHLNIRFKTSTVVSQCQRLSVELQPKFEAAAREIANIRAYANECFDEVRASFMSTSRKEYNQDFEIVNVKPKKQGAEAQKASPPLEPPTTDQESPTTKKKTPSVDPPAPSAPPPPRTYTTGLLPVPNTHNRPPPPRTYTKGAKRKAIDSDSDSDSDFEPNLNSDIGHFFTPIENFYYSEL